MYMCFGLGMTILYAPGSPTGILLNWIILARLVWEETSHAPLKEFLD